MTVKTTQSMMRRFSGASGKKRLLDCLCRQQLVAGDLSLAKELVKHGSLLDVHQDKCVVKQGQSDDDLYFIITGSVSVCVNSREIATRHASMHFGEMALADPTARRSATVKTLERCALSCIS